MSAPSAPSATAGSRPRSFLPPAPASGVPPGLAASSGRKRSRRPLRTWDAPLPHLGLRTTKGGL
eukprot:6496601-Alexandrium_andersonii.AAC.1